MNKMMVLSGAAVLALAFESGAHADPMVLDCYNVKGKVVACKGNFPDGKPAAGAEFTLFNKDKVKMGSGKTDEHGVYLFKAPPDEYIVVIAAPPLLSSLPSNDIDAKSERPGWGGDWVDVDAVDRLDKMKLWQEQFLSEKGPLIEKAEDGHDK